VNKVEVVGMVYRSNSFLSLLREQGCVDRIVANDPWPGLDTTNVETYHDPKPDDHYLSRVYRCWNHCVRTSKAEYVCLVNSDMIFSFGWLTPLFRQLDGKTLPCSRLVEPGFIQPGEHAVEIDLGRDPSDFPFEAWDRLVEDLKEEYRVEPGGLFMPCVLHKETFLRVGGYPEGNLRVDGKIVSGDADLFLRMREAGFQHVTCFDSLVYHMQEGEMSQPSILTAARA